MEAKPIASAPKDGTRFIAYGRDGWVVVRWSWDVPSCYSWWVKILMPGE